jgi:hypothetical protein
MCFSYSPPQYIEPMDSSNIEKLISMADQALVDFSDSDLSANLGDRAPVVIPTSADQPSAQPSVQPSAQPSVQPAVEAPPVNNPSSSGVASVSTGDLMKTVAEFTDSMADSLDSPDVPAGIRLPQDPIDSVSSTDTSRISNRPQMAARSVVPPSAQRSVQSQPQSRAPPSNRPSVRPPTGGARPPLRMPNHRPTVEQTMRNIATRHNLQNGASGPPRPRPPTQSAPPVANQVPAVPPQNAPTAPAQEPNPPALDPNQVPHPAPDQNGGAQNGVPPAGDPAAPVALPDHMTSLMGYSIPIATLYLILVLVLIAVALYFWTAPPPPKTDKKKKKKDDDDEDDE